MHQSPLGRLPRVLVALTGLISFSVAHSWVEQMVVIDTNGTYVGTPGYARGNVPRTTPGFNDGDMTNLIPPNGRPTGNEVLTTDPICMNTQQTMNQTDGSPRLQAAAGSYVALRYQENGHVTLPQNQPGKPANRGTVYVYGTTQPQQNDTLLAVHMVWNTAGTGGDGRGKLLSTENFDDGQCYQINDGNISEARQAEFKVTPNQLMGANLWCQNDIALPSDAPSGQPYTLYWVWDWPTAPGVDPSIPDGKTEIYTTCMDIDIATSSAQNDTNSVHYVQGQGLTEAGVSSYVNDLESGTTILVTQSAQTVETGAPSAEATQTSPTANVQSISSILPATSLAAAKAPPSVSPTTSTYTPPTIISAPPVESSSSQPSSAPADDGVTITATVSPIAAPSNTQLAGSSGTVISTVIVSPLPATPTSQGGGSSSTAASPVASSPSSTLSSSTAADGSTCGPATVQKRSRILDGATRHTSSKLGSGHIRGNRKSTTPRSAKFRYF
ncbi:hypothetical protein MMC08_002700 [Hypocenomyce scalaris]|nr:hypothetical protein [Hypocenomyce scalaris]